MYIVVVYMIWYDIRYGWNTYAVARKVCVYITIYLDQTLIIIDVKIKWYDKR